RRRRRAGPRSAPRESRRSARPRRCSPREARRSRGEPCSRLLSFLEDEELVEERACRARRRVEVAAVLEGDRPLGGEERRPYPDLEVVAEVARSMGEIEERRDEGRREELARGGLVEVARNLDDVALSQLLRFEL